MKVQKIYLIRHGQTDANKTNIYQGVSIDPPLNETGKQQAELLAKYFRKHYGSVPVIITSPARRAYETASAVWRIMATPTVQTMPLPTLIIEKDLQEINHGQWEGKTPDQIKEFDAETQEKWWHGNTFEVAFPGGETIADAYARAQRVFVWVLNTFPDEDVVIVAHGGTNALILSSILEAKNPRALSQKNTAINIIERHDGKYLKIPLIGSTAHLL